MVSKNSPAGLSLQIGAAASGLCPTSLCSRSPHWSLEELTDRLEQDLEVLESKFQSFVTVHSRRQIQSTKRIEDF